MSDPQQHIRPLKIVCERKADVASRRYVVQWRNNYDVWLPEEGNKGYFTKLGAYFKVKIWNSIGYDAHIIDTKK